ncbi:MAG: sugar phosphate isomerase/epimerase family protein [Clostridia bacterium]
MKTSISTYSFYRLISEGKMTYFDAVDKTKELGCDGAEICVIGDIAGGNFEEYVTKLIAHAREIGLEVPIFTTDANFLCADVNSEIARVKRNVDIAAKNNISLMRHDVAWDFYQGYEGIKTFEAALPRIAAAIREVAEYAQSKGVVTCSENHGRFVQDSDRMLALFTAVNHPNYRWLCDIGNFGCVDEDCAIAVSKLLPFLSHVHAKDAFWRSGMLPNPGKGWSKTRAGNFRRATIFGHGDVPAQQIFSIIRDSGYDGYVSLEFEGIEDVLTAIEISIENLKKALNV